MGNGIVHVSKPDMDRHELRRFRRAVDLSPDELGTAVDMDGSHVEDMEQGTLTTTGPVALALHVVLDRSMD